MLTALEILTAWIKATPNTDDIDRMIAMSAYMAKRLEADMLKPLQQLEAEVWPELASQQSEEGDSNDTVL